MLNNKGLERGYKELLKYHHDIKGCCLLRRHTRNNKNMIEHNSINILFPTRLLTVERGTRRRLKPGRSNTKAFFPPFITIIYVTWKYTHPPYG